MEPGEFIESMKDDQTFAGFFAPVESAQQAPQVQPNQQPRQTQQATSTSSTAAKDVLAKNPVERLKQFRRDQAEAASRAK